MARIEKTVFISYRRKDISWALAVYQYLTNQNYDVFFDYTSIPSGDFEQIIVSNIKARAHFLLILTPTSLDRCNNPGDWLRREIETAMDEKRNIVPLFFDGFSFGLPNVTEKLTGRLADVKRYNGLDIPLGYFPEAMDRLSVRYLNVPLSAVLHPVPTEVKKVVRDEKSAANKALLEQKVYRQEDVEVPLIGVRTWVFGKIEFVKVPQGVFLMGSKADNNIASRHEKPQHKLNIPYDYFMVRFPVTNERFSQFVKAVEFRDSWGVKDWQHLLMHPVVNVTWQNAVVYCDWLNQVFGENIPDGLVFRLPTEAEWEKGARGTDGREYPWGNEFNPNNCNSQESRIGSTLSVGTFSPQGDSPYRVSDMVGNIWEWTISLWGRDTTPDFNYPYDPKDGREVLKTSTFRRVLRGGSFKLDSKNVRVASRYGDNPNISYEDFGLRVVLAPPIVN